MSRLQGAPLARGVSATRVPAMPRCLTRSIWIDGLHVPLSRCRVTLADGTPLRVRAGAGVHVRDLIGPVTVQVHTPVGVHTTSLDPEAAFGRAGRRVSTPLTSAPQVYLAVQAALENPTPAVLAQIAGADATWVRAMISHEDGIVDDLAEQDPARRAAALQIIAAHPGLRDSEEAAALVRQEVTRWSLSRPSALLLYALHEGTDVDLLARLGAANTDWDSEALPLSQSWVPERARARLRSVWSQQMGTVSPRARVLTLQLLVRPRTLSPADMLTLPEAARDLIFGGEERSTTIMRLARDAVMDAATGEDILTAATGGAYMAALVHLMSHPQPYAALGEVDVDTVMAAMEGAQLGPLEVRARRAWVTARLGRTYADIDAARRNAQEHEETNIRWYPGSGERFAAAVLANENLTQADRHRYLTQIRADERSGNTDGPFSIYPDVATQMTLSGDTQAAYRLLLHEQHRPYYLTQEGVGESVAAAWRTWNKPQQRKALRYRADILLPYLSSDDDIARLREVIATVQDPAPALSVLAARTPEQVRERVRTTEPITRWQALPGLVMHPDLDVAAKAQVLTSAEMTEAAGESLAGDTGLLMWGYGTPLFSRRIEQAARALAEPRVYGTDTLLQMPPALVWLAAYTLTQDKDHVDTALSLAQDWHDSPAALAAAVESLLRA